MIHHTSVKQDSPSRHPGEWSQEEDPAHSGEPGAPDGFAWIHNRRKELLKLAFGCALLGG